MALAFERMLAANDLSLFSDIPELPSLTRHHVLE
jgi:hypothetical protein